MRRKRVYIVHNLSQGTSELTYGVKETQGYLRSRGCTLDNNTFMDYATEMHEDFTGITSRGSSGDEYEIDVLG